MSYLSKKEVLAAIATRTKTVKGKAYTVYDAYIGTNPLTGKQVRLARSSLQDLKDDIEDFYKRLRSAGDAGGALTAAQSVDALQALHALSDAHIDISLMECVRKLMEYKLIGENKPKSITLGDALAEYLETLSDKTENRRTVKTRVGRWAYDFGMERYLTEVTEQDVMGWIDKNYPNPKTHNNHMTYIRTFFSWCMVKSRRYILENPLECVKKKPEIVHRPKYMKAADVERLLRLLEKEKTTRPDLLAYAIISFFCGIRREEIFRGSDEEDAIELDFEHATVVVLKVKRYTQGAHPRSFPMSKAFMAWAASFDFDDGYKRINHHVVFNIRQRVERHNATAPQNEQIDMPKNPGRHTFITQMLAMTHDLQKTCQYAGTSPQMVQNNYNGMSYEEDALKFFGIRPSPTVD